MHHLRAFEQHGAFPANLHFAFKFINGGFIFSADKSKRKANVMLTFVILTFRQANKINPAQGGRNKK